eukprot:CAMPEP_0185599980 /NCGR_PEP_ID=MMETSP0434-20130131/83082_1 /TAXON_ID=626734 ORGANISM="Favella taraikaensis, Strain Fe Narragansett Bay" /NCGR_SAMPLE_ID=MMETSP0434 /ASSEMBLY_ACC=CAM_ASM_000379 /LENGTH=36 /DNA_ID= /DNA_START= /DNA_END= /DNA_ORIENTATION=
MLADEWLEVGLEMEGVFALGDSVADQGVKLGAWLAV